MALIGMHLVFLHFNHDINILLFFQGNYFDPFLWMDEFKDNVPDHIHAGYDLVKN